MTFKVLFDNNAVQPSRQYELTIIRRCPAATSSYTRLVRTGNRVLRRFFL